MGNQLKSDVFIGVVCISILLGTLSAGLWPFHAPKNHVTWLSDGLWFGRRATALSFAPLATYPAAAGSGRSIEIWLQPEHIWNENTILAFYQSGEPQQFSLHQFDAGFDLQTDLNSALVQDDPSKVAHLPRIFFKRCRPLVTITFGNQGTAAYVNGVLAKVFPRFRPGDKAFTGRLVLGNSPVENDSWSGLWLGLAIYNHELTAAQVRRHFESWTAKGRPDISESERNTALYLFNQHSGNIVHNVADERDGSRDDLLIPEKYTVLDEKFLEPPWKEFRWRWGYGKNVLINVFGFVPLGFFFACLFARRTQTPSFATIALGAAVSLTIEVLQAFLPTRDSGTTDLITNTLGTGLGVMFYRWKPALVTHTLGRLPLLHRAR